MLKRSGVIFALILALAIPLSPQLKKRRLLAIGDVHRKILDHPDAPVIVEDPSFPAMKAFPKAFSARDEIYQVRNFSRDRVRVLARLDPAKLDLRNPRVHRTDNDWRLPGREATVVAGFSIRPFGHTEESWDDPAMQTMWVEAIKWAMGLTNADVTPRPAP
jgi:type 1 glutamine amidotransferase